MRPATEFGVARRREADESARPISASDLDDSMHRLVQDVRPWEAGRFKFVHHVEMAGRNHGRVDAMRWGGVRGDLVAVKQMPNWWIEAGVEQFGKAHPEEQEQPWYDLGLLAELKSRRFPYTCDLLGIFRDERFTYVVTALASGGDLFSWTGTLPKDPGAREGLMQPIAGQLCSAVRLLHEVGVAHRDLSLENVVLSTVDSSPRVRLIDFGMARVGRFQDSCAQTAVFGKRMYRAPELHCSETCDAFLADIFAIGVMLYGMALSDYPWNTTEPGKSDSLEHARDVGLSTHLQQLIFRGKPLGHVLSPGLIELMAALLAIAPADRVGLGESCFSQAGRASVWSSAWLRSSHCMPARCEFESAHAVPLCEDKEPRQGFKSLSVCTGGVGFCKTLSDATTAASPSYVSLSSLCDVEQPEKGPGAPSGGEKEDPWEYLLAMT